MKVDHPKFIVDCMGGNIARKLRVMGFDTEFWLDASDDFLINKSNHENKILVTRDRGPPFKALKIEQEWIVTP